MSKAGTDGPATTPAPVDALGISFKAITDKEGRREVVLQTHLPRDIKPFLLDELLDKLSNAVERQAAKADLEQLQRHIIEIEKQTENFALQLKTLDDKTQADWLSGGRHGAWDPAKLPPKDRQAREQVKNGVERHKQEIIILRKRIAELTEVVNRNAPSVAADHNTGVPDR